MLDVGANIGMMALLAAKCVGESGRVFAIEPNRECIERISAAIAMNKIRNIEVIEGALGSREGTGRLAVLSRHSGMGTVANLGEDEMDRISEQYSVRIMRGDEVLHGVRPTLIKIDVEGFEWRVLRGMEETIGESGPGIVLEMNDGLLKRDGRRGEDILQWMTKREYVGFELGAARQGWRYGLVLAPYDPSFRRNMNVLWLKRKSMMWRRLAHMLPDA